MKRISAPEQTREQLRALIEGLEDCAERSSLVPLAARLILEEALLTVSVTSGRTRSGARKGVALAVRAIPLQAVTLAGVAAFAVRDPLFVAAPECAALAGCTDLPIPCKR